MIEYERNDELDRMVAHLVAELHEFAAIRETAIMPLMKIKMGKDTEELVEAKPAFDTKKVPDLYRAISDDAAHFVVIIDMYVWNHCEAQEREALVHSALMRIDVNEEKQKIRKPDVVFYSATLRRYGQFDGSVRELRDILTSAGTAAANFIARSAQPVLEGEEQ